MIFCAIHSQHSESRSTCDKKLLLARDAEEDDALKKKYIWRRDCGHNIVT